VPPTGESRADFTITSQIAQHRGLALERASVSAVFEALAASVKAFAGLNYAKVSEVRSQWPIVGRGDMYYGGTTYENTMGLGAHLTAAAADKEELSIPKARNQKTLRPRDKQLLAVPVTRLYDRGTTVMMSANLLRDRIGGQVITLNPEAAKNLGVEAGQLVNISFDGVSGDAVVNLDDTISVGVALVPREMGLTIREPVPVEVRALVKVE